MNDRSAPPAGRRRCTRWLLAAVAALCLILVLLVCIRPGMNPYAYAPCSFLPMQPESVSEDTGENGLLTRSYSFTVPEGAIVRRGLRLSVYLQHSYVKVWLDGELQYSSWEDGSRHIGRTPGNYWLAAALRSDYSGKTLRIEITPVYGAGCVSPSWLVPVPEVARPGEPQFLLIFNICLILPCQGAGSDNDHMFEVVSLFPETPEHLAHQDVFAGTMTHQTRN